MGRDLLANWKETAEYEELQCGTEPHDLGFTVLLFHLLAVKRIDNGLRTG